MKKLKYSILISLIFLTFTNFLFSQNYWSKLNGPYGGNVVELKSQSNGNLYALRNEGLYISTNSSESWNKLEGMIANSNLCMDISSSGIIYVGKSSGGIWWSANSGQSWDFNPLHIAPHSGLWASVIVVKVNSLGHVYVNNYVSFNGGQSFSNFLIGNASVLAGDYAFNSFNHVYAATNNGIFYSVNNASSWTNINGNLPAVNSTSLMFDNDVLIAGINGSGIYKTTTNGISWEPINNGLTDLNINKVYKDVANNYYAGTFSGKVYKSSDQGSSWTEIFTSSTNNVINTIYTNGNSIYNTSSMLGVVKSADNGITWIEKNFNLSLPGINSLAFSDNDEIFASSFSGIYYSADNGNNWTKRNSLLPTLFVNSIYRASNGELLAGLYNTGIYRSLDNGNTWQPSSNGILPEGRFDFIKPSPNGYLYTASIPGAFVDTMKLYRSSDNGMNWSKIYQPESTGFDRFDIDASGTLYMAGTGSSFQATVLRSTDNGNTWNEDILEGFFFIDNFTVQGNNLYMTSSANIYISTDMGVAWNQIDNGSWQPASISCLAVNSLGNILVTVGSEFYLTTNSGSSWSMHSSGLVQSSPINNLILRNDGYLFGITYYGGIFKSTQSTLTSISNIINNVPPNFNLKQNYPNPFNPATVISYQLTVNSYAKLKIFDILGNEVATLVNEKQNEGSYSVEFNGSNYPSGIYYYKLEVRYGQEGGFSEVKKMTLLK
ncbi:MAG: T9SS type A sorting domain-containing protein [bacterium]